MEEKPKSGASREVFSLNAQNFKLKYIFHWLIRKSLYICDGRVRWEVVAVAVLLFNIYFFHDYYYCYLNVRVSALVHTQSIIGARKKIVLTRTTSATPASVCVCVCMRAR